MKQDSLVHLLCTEECSGCNYGALFLPTMCEPITNTSQTVLNSQPFYRVKTEKSVERQSF